MLVVPELEGLVCEGRGLSDQLEFRVARFPLLAIELELLVEFDEASRILELIWGEQGTELVKEEGPSSFERL